MYAVSNEFLDAIQENTRQYYWSGSIAAKNGTVIHFDSQDIVKGSGCISHQCCGGSEIELGTVYAAEVNITLYLELDRYLLEGGLIKLYFHLNVEADEYETVPFGLFEICEANHMVKCMELKAYDYMLRFDRAFQKWSMAGTAYDLLAMACKECNVELKHSKEELESVSNGGFILSIYSENDIETWRDVVFYSAQVLGCFAVIDREGRLELRRYGKDPVLTVTDKQRFTSSFSDFITRYTAISSTNARTARAEYYAMDQDDGLTMNLGMNPLLQYGTASFRSEILTNTLNQLADIQYVPLQTDTIGNPALDLGDIVSFAGGQADNTKISCITAYSFRINGKQHIKCVGKNPRLSQAKSKNDKNIVGLQSQIEAGKVSVQTYKNASEYVVGEADTEIIGMEFVTLLDTAAQLNASVLLEIQIDRNQEIYNDTNGLPFQVPRDFPLEEGTAMGVVTFEWEEERMETFQPMQIWRSGNQILSLYYPFVGLEGNKVSKIKVFLRMVGGRAVIRPGGIVAGICGQGILKSEAAEWDGYIRLEETIPLIRSGFACMETQDGFLTKKLQVENVYSLSNTIPIQKAGFTLNKIRKPDIKMDLQEESGTEVSERTGKLFLGFGLLYVKETCMIE